MLKYLVVSIALIFMVSTSAMAQGDPAAGKIKGNTCTGCHAIPGYNNTYPTYKVPKLGGQNVSYLVSALKAYRSGDRLHSTMRANAMSLNDQDIEDISAWLASFDRIPAAQAPELPEEISTQVQICTSCHGNDGLAADPSYPALAGQHASYISQALKSYRSGARKNAIMGGFASNLTDQDIEGIANWYSQMSGLTDLADY